MNIIFSLVIFAFGLIVGSFLNCVIYRLEKEESPLKGRSYCPKCKHTLSWQDLIPVFSFLILKGKCRYCKNKISWQYPAVEIATALLFLLILNFQFSWTRSGLPGGLIFNEFSIFNFQTLLVTCYLFLVSCFLIVIFVSDLKTFLIPDKVIYPAVVIAFIYRVFEFLLLNHWKLKIENFGVITNPLYAALGASTFFLLIFLISRGRWMGFGDVKLAFFMGLFLGFPNILVALFLAFLIGAIIGVGLISVKRKTLKSELPFGPFLILGTFIALFWGEIIINWYFNLFGI